MSSDTRLSLSDVRGPINDLLEKLEGKNGRTWLQELNKFLRKENPWETPETFIELEIGIYRSVETLREALKDDGVCITKGADDILGKTKLFRPKKILELIVISVKELGFLHGAQREQIYEAAKNLDLGLCPAEVGPYLCLQYQDQPDLIVAMEPIPISNSGGNLFVFVTHRSGDRLWLGTYCGRSNTVWSSNDQIVFVRCR